MLLTLGDTNGVTRNPTSDLCLLGPLRQDVTGACPDWATSPESRARFLLAGSSESWFQVNPVRLPGFGTIPPGFYGW